ncbi:MAG: ORF6N domain-containing protein, partial [Crocinitomicaceae bacterium]|nr:ORF6N domain-containing protein [Crocinitomicaceae bacterium]
LIIDNKDLYHIGDSLKDLGKKWFAFSKINELLSELLAKLHLI